jgi:hypothetical protein
MWHEYGLEGKLVITIWENILSVNNKEPGMLQEFEIWI